MRLSRLALAAAAVVVAAAPAAAQSTGSLQIHGYLTQGYAVSDGSQFYGITEHGSSDFRYAALQFRYDKKQDGFLLQVNHRQLGASPIGDFESNLNVNWAFYQRTLANGSWVKVGRVPVPQGIYNEQRSIGILLPFYRPPAVFYDEGAYFSETIDGVVMAHSFRRDLPWSVDVYAYGGGWTQLWYDQTGAEYAIGASRAENAVGAQMWLNLPIEGVRVGVAGQRYRLDYGDDEFESVQQYQASFDATRERWFLRAESQMQQYEPDRFFSSYAQLGVKVTPKLGVNVQQELSNVTRWEIAPWPEEFDWHRATGVGATYAFTPTLVLKLEHHWNEGVQVEQASDPTAPPRFAYTIASVSAAF